MSKMTLTDTFLRDRRAVGALLLFSLAFLTLAYYTWSFLKRPKKADLPIFHVVPGTDAAKVLMEAHEEVRSGGAVPLKHLLTAPVS